MAKHFDKEFKTNAVRYYHEHRDLGLAGSAANLGICQQTKVAQFARQNFSLFVMN